VTVDVVIDADGVPISGLLAVPDSEPRALVVALHGGGLRAVYFDGRVHSDTSFLTLAAGLGHVALSLDRPGYGASAATLPDGLHLPDQARVTLAAIEVFRSEHGIDAPLVLLGHSFGMKLALQIAATANANGLIGVDCSGAGVRYNHELRSYPGLDPDGTISLTAAERMELFWGPAHLYPPRALDRDHRPTAPVPSAEAVDSVAWPELLREIAPKVRVPVRYTVADGERWWDVRPETLAEFVALFTASPRVEVAHQVRAGHNISLGWTARAYHLHVSAFVEECLVDRAAAAAR
jgi:pimeloyl-ACP methyl ester carboxylesterase